MRLTLLFLTLAALFAAPASARREIHPAREVRHTRQTVWFWFDRLEPPDPGWAHGDFTADATPHFHLDAYLAYSGDYSWWCGTFDYGPDGGYGNRWDDRLDIPPIMTAVEEVSWGSIKAMFRSGAASTKREYPGRPTYPVLTFAYRNDSEPMYDLTYVDAESAGVFVHLNHGYGGQHPWSEASFYLGDMDWPCACRFRFVSDAEWSDEDGDYPTLGGAFMCDEIRIWDYYSGTVYFYDDAESGGLCLPSVPEPAGDYWHIIESNCKAWSDPHVWVNTSVDTPGFVPPGVRNWLVTPVIDVSDAVTCTTYFALQFFTPIVGNDYWVEEISTDGGASWVQLHVWWGDQCDEGYGPCDHFRGGGDVSAFIPADVIALRWVYYSNDNGVGPDVCGNAGIAIDDVGMYGYAPIGGEEARGWGRVRSLYR